MSAEFQDFLASPRQRILPLRPRTLTASVRLRAGTLGARSSGDSSSLLLRGRRAFESPRAHYGGVTEWFRCLPAKQVLPRFNSGLRLLKGAHTLELFARTITV